MKKNYLILWIDDEEDSVRTSIKEITQHLKATGVVANVVYSNPANWSNGYNSNEDVVKCIEDPELDMVLMDYNLGDSLGKDLIAQLRQQNVYVPVVYYSQQHFEDLQKSLLSENVDGVFIAHRDYLEERTKKILDSLLKKEHKVRRMRGLLLSDASEFEAQGAEIAEKCWSLLNNDQKTHVRSKIKGYISTSMKSLNKSFDKIDFEFDDVKEFWKLRFLDSDKRGYLLQKICEQLGWEDHKSNISCLCGKEQPIHVFSERNKFAHQTEQELQEAIDRLEGIDFPKELREELHKAEKNMKELLIAIKNKEEKV
jgi:CheY-like chemotaxis protein